MGGGGGGGSRESATKCVRPGRCFSLFPSVPPPPVISPEAVHLGDLLLEPALLEAIAVYGTLPSKASGMQGLRGPAKPLKALKALNLEKIYIF